MKKTILYFFLLYPFFSIIGQSADWELEVDKDGILVYTRLPEGTNFKEFKAEVELDCNWKSVLRVINTPERSSDWYDSVSETRVLKESGEGEGYYYSLYDAPWPVADRDNIVYVSTEKKNENGELLINIRSAYDYLPKVSGVVRIEVLESLWLIIPMGANKTKLVHQTYVEPNGYIPAWVANRFVTQGPFKTLQNLKKMVKLPEFKLN